MAAAPIFILYLWTALDQRAQLRGLAEDQLVRSARLLSAQQLQFLMGARDLLAAASVIADEAAAGPPCNALLTRMVETSSAFTFIAVATIDGDVFCSSDPVGIDIQEADFFVEAVETGDLAIGMPEDRNLPIALAPRADDAEPTMVAVGAVDLDVLAATMTLSRLPADAIGVVFDASRSVLARVPAGATIDETVFAPVGPEIANSGGGPGLVQAIDANGGDRIWAVADLLPSQGLYVAIGVGVAGLFAEADTILWRGLGMLLAVLLVAAIGARILGESMIHKPVARLARSVSDMRSGDFTARVHAASSARELRQLEDDFNSMAGALEVHDEELKARNARLNELVGEKDTLVREMNHRIKNSLQLVSSVLRLQRDDIKDPGAATGLLDAETRVAAVAKVHERLYTSERTDRIEIGPFLLGLCSDLGRAVENGKKGRKINVSSIDVELPPDQVVSIGMIVTELVTNAVKHSGPDGSDSVEVRLEETGSEMRLTVSDDGPGFPEDFDISQATGLGLRVANVLARQLGSSLVIDRSASGASVSITFSPAPNDHRSKDS